MKAILAGLFIFFFPFFLFSQNIRHLSVEDGLPQSFISGIVENKKGFIWLSTRNGLARFDGYNFKIFQHIHNDKSTISSNLIQTIKEGANNSLWIQFDSGEIDNFSFDTEKSRSVIDKAFLEKYDLNISRKSWLVDQNNMLWFKTKNNELYKVSLSNKKKISSYGFHFAKYGQIYNIVETTNNEIWVLSDKAIGKFDKRNDKFIFIANPYKLFPENYKKDGEIFTAFTVRKNGELMWADNKYLYFYNIEKKIFRNLPIPSSSMLPVRYIDTDSSGKDFFVLNDIIYQYTDKFGITKVCNTSINSKYQAFLVDKSGLFWLAGDAEGLFTIDTSIDFVSFDYKEDFSIDILKKYYNISALQFFKWKQYPIGVLNPSYYIRSVQYKEGVWLALNRTVACFDNAGKIISKLPDLPKIINPKFSPITGFSLYNNVPVVIDRNNTIYIFDELHNNWKKLLSVDHNFSHLKENIITRGMQADEHTKSLWITTEANGLIRVDLLTKKVTFIKSSKQGLPTNNLISIRQDPKRQDKLWIGSSMGLICFDKRTHECRTFSLKDGFHDNFIYLILPDNSGNLWLGTNKGLVRFNTENFKVRVFTKNHGLKNLEFNHFHQLPLPNNQIAFGGLKKGVVFSPKSIKEDTVSPVTVITGIEINNQDINEIKTNLKPVHTLKVLEVAYDENNISISFAALQFGQPLGNDYRYRLKGYDNEWINAGNKREAVYTKIPPGNYIFEINATNTSGKWSTHIASLEVNITPPWWGTWWAMLLYLFILISTAIWFFKFKLHQQIIKKEIELKRREADELRKLELTKSHFFSNIAHDFRTPLALIQGPAEQLKKSDKDKDMLLEIITKNTSNLINLTDQLMDIAKLEAGIFNPQMIWGDIIFVISNVIDSFIEEAQRKNIKIELKSPAVAEFLFSINSIERILYNLLANAIRFTESGGVITVSVFKNKGGLELKVQDTGKGIPLLEKENIFDRFYVGTNSHKGTGIGLSFVYDLVKLHNGTITVESQILAPSGTTFNIWLPLCVPHEILEEVVLIEDINVKQYTILLVEDHRELSYFISSTLKYTYNVLIANDGREALDLCFNKMPDLIISDIAMEGMDGFKFCEEVKMNMTIDHIPIILLTAKADVESRLKGLALGASDYITKPFSIEELHLKIKNQLDTQKKLRERYHNSLTNPLDESEIRSESPCNVFLQKIHEIIDINLDNNDLSVEFLAESLFISRANLQRKVKSLCNLSAGEIIKNYRLTKAAELLSKGFTISEVGHMVGFSTPSYFSKSFRDFYEMTPSEYIKKCNMR